MITVYHLVPRATDSRPDPRPTSSWTLTVCGRCRKSVRLDCNGEIYPHECVRAVDPQDWERA